MPVGLTIEYAVGGASGEAAVERLQVAFERAGDNLKDMGKYVFPRLVPVFEAEVGGQFDARGRGPAGGAWQQLSAAYADWKAQAFPGKGILEATGDMRAALTQSSSPLALRDYSGTEFNFGTRGVEYASFHQLGTARMVARPPFDFTPGMERALVRAAATGVREAVRDAGLEAEGDE